jgi:hypothetical protein
MVEGNYSLLQAQLRASTSLTLHPHPADLHNRQLNDGCSTPAPNLAQGTSLTQGK